MVGMGVRFGLELGSETLRASFVRLRGKEFQACLHSDRPYSSPQQNTN